MTLEETQEVAPFLWSSRTAIQLPSGRFAAAAVGDHFVGPLNVPKFKQHLPPEFPDRAALHFLQFGWPGKNGVARGVAVMNVLQSATPYMQELNKIIEDEVRDGTLLATDGYFPPTYPFIGAGTGVAFKKWKEQKPRITWAADPLTIPEKDAQGKPWAVNAGEPEDQPMMTWHRTKDYANAGAVIYAVYRSVVARRPDLKKVLIPESCSFDYKGFYRQLFMKLPSLCQQGFFFSKTRLLPKMAVQSFHAVRRRRIS